jgi:hypothetical protein
MYQFLDEHGMWSLVEKNPKEMGCLKNTIQGKFMRIKKEVKIMFF